MSTEKKGIKKVRKLSVEEANSEIDQYQDSLAVEEPPVIQNIPINEVPIIQNTPKRVENKVIPQQKKIEDKKSKYLEELEHDDDIFDEDGNLIQAESEASKRVQELRRKLKEQLSLLFDLIKEKLRGPIIKIKASIIKIFSKILIPITNIFNKILNLISEKLFKNKKINIEVQEEVQEEQEISLEEKYLMSNFNEMRDLNIIFTDNFDISFYKKKKEGTPAFSRTEEELMMANAIDSIKQCAEFTMDVPPIQEGIFEGNRVSNIMENVTDLEIKLFLGYVKVRPQKYTSKAWKISETFATWLVNNSPVAEKK